MAGANLPPVVPLRIAWAQRGTNSGRKREEKKGPRSCRDFAVAESYGKERQGQGHERNRERDSKGRRKAKRDAAVMPFRSEADRA